MKSESQSEREGLHLAYQSEEEYFLNHCIQKVEFARYQVSRQLESAINRKKEQSFELKLFVGILAAFILFYNMALAMTAAGGVLSYIGAVTVMLCYIAYLIVMPVCVFKIVKSILILVVNRQGRVGAWIARRYSLPLYHTEIQSCRTYLEKYRILLEDLENCKDKLGEEETSWTDFIKERMESTDLEPQIEVVSLNYGKLHKFAAVSSVIVTLLVCIILLL